MSDINSKKEAEIKNISIFFPCYNEAENLPKIVNKTVDVFKNITDNYEIIIINDGSNDNTKQTADNLSRQYKNIRIVNHEVNKGYGAALQSGFRNAKNDLIFFSDGDNQFDISEITKLLPLIQENDIVTGYRINRKDNFTRRLNALLWNLLIRLLFKIKIKDLNCAFKLYKREIFSKISPESTGALINTEIFAKAHKLGYKIAEVGVNHYPRTAGNPTGANIKVILKAFYELFVMYKRMK